MARGKSIASASLSHHGECHCPLFIQHALVVIQPIHMLIIGVNIKSDAVGIKALNFPLTSKVLTST